MPTIDNPVTITIDGHTYTSVTFKVAEYANRRLAIALICDDGTLLAKATVNMPESETTPGCVFIKNWGENAGLLEELERLGIGKRTGREIASGFVTVPEFQLDGDWASVIARVEGR